LLDLILHNKLAGSVLDCLSATSEEMADEWSQYLSEYALPPTVPTSQVRAVFTDTKFVEQTPVEGHTHGLSASLRNSASLFIDQCAAALGRDVVFYQGSASDVRQGRKISRSTYWGKDLQVEPVPFKPSKNDCVAMIDVDEYVDMPRHLGDYFLPTFIYTFQPASVAKTSGDYKYSFLESNEVDYVVSGGANYKHKVWNYDGDCLKVVKRCKTLGYIKSVSFYSLERRQVDADHQLILLAPLAKYKGEPAWVADLALGGKELERLEVARNGFTRLTTNESDGMSVHTGIAGEFVSCVVSAQADSTLNQMAKLQSTPLTMSQVKQFTETTPDNSPAALWAYHRTKQVHWTGSQVSTCKQHVNSYQFVDKFDKYDPDAKPSMESFMDPILDGAFAPDLCKANDKRSIDERLNKVKSDVEADVFVMKVMREFVKKFAEGNERSLRPVELDEVYARQKTPRQRRILEQAEFIFSPARFNSSFMKRECSQNVSDPRNISTINGSDKRDYSSFMYAFSEYVKKFEWYAFSKSPKEQAQRVADICEMARTILETDFSRMDGRVSPAARMLEKLLMMAMFKEQHQAELFELMRSQVSLRGMTKFGVGFESGTSRLSGSPETSVLNTILNAFVAFLALRKTKVDGKYLSVDEAWARLGIYGGDDGISRDINPVVYANAAKQVGQVLTSEEKTCGTVGVKFLARLYGPEVWKGDPSSMCDLPRTLSKLHTTVRLPDNITAEQKLIDKAHALSLTDAQTPVVGPYVAKVLEHKPGNFVFENYARKWMPEEDVNKQYPNTAGDWMMDVARDTMPEFAFGQFNDWVNGDVGLDDLMKCPRFHPSVEPKAPPGIITVVNGDVVKPAEPDEPMPMPIGTVPDELESKTSKSVRPTGPTPDIPAERKFRPRKKKKDRPSRVALKPPASTTANPPKKKGTEYRKKSS